MSEIKDHIYGCLLGVAAGDAMGMPTSLMSPERIKKTFKSYIIDFLPAPEGHTIHNSMVAGQITDDTQQTLLIADSIIENWGINPQDIADRLIDWAERIGAFESLVVGPSSLRALHMIRAGIPIERTGITGDTNGASMRISAVGIYGMGDLEKTVNSVADSCLPTHYTNIAIAGASSVAIVMGSAIAGEKNVDRLIELAMWAVEEGMKKGNDWYGASIIDRTDLALSIVNNHKDKKQILHELYNKIGAGVATTETVPICLALLKLSDGDPMDAIQMATNLGGDCDTTSSIVGGMCGAISGIEAFPIRWIEKLEETNNLRLEEYAEKLFTVVDSIQNDKYGEKTNS